MRAVHVFTQSDGSVTREYYARLISRGPIGVIAMNLFRAQKCSHRAKKYRGGIAGKGSYAHLAYERKNYSLKELCDALSIHSKNSEITFGWKLDPAQSWACWVLYIDLPNGQVSFHCTERYAGPDYSGDWDHQRASEIRILQFCDHVFDTVGYAGGVAITQNEQDAFHFA